MEGYTKKFEIGSEVVLQQSAFSFDFSMDQIFSALTTGSTLYIVSKDQRGDPAEISRIIASEGVTYTKATPSEYSSWIRYGAPDLRTATKWTKAFVGGEPLTHQHLKAFQTLSRPPLRLLNCKMQPHFPQTR
jgi:hybrid polyketide synthase/nonribosomal peptide synthetase ACE1